MNRGNRIRIGRIVLAACLAGAGCAPRNPTTPPAPTPSVPIPAPPLADRLPELLQRAESEPRRPEPQLELGKHYAERGESTRALACFQRAAALNPRLVPAVLGIGQMWLALGRPGKAVQAYSRAAELMPNEPLIELELAAACLDLRDFPRALAHARKAEKLDPGNPEVYRALGTIHSGTGNLTLTMESGQKAIDLAPNDERNWVHAGGLAYGVREFKKAAGYFRRALELNPANVDANVMLADCINQLDQTPATQLEMQGLLVRALTVDPQQARALYQLGRLYFEQGKLDLAVTTLRRAVHWDPMTQETVLALGQALVRAGEVKEGRTIIARAQQAIDRTVDFRGLEYQAFQNPNPDVHLRLATLYRRNRQYDSALNTVERGLRLTPGNRALAALRAELLRRPPAQPAGVRP